MSPAAPRIALLGAFHFPVPQGSQVFVAEQARALVQQGARVTLVSYGGRTQIVEPFAIEQTPAWSAPGSHRSGPQLRKPLSDTLLLRTLLAAHGRAPFDAVLAHNAEAAVVALGARRKLGVPVLYVAHTLFGEELQVYGPARFEGFARSLGRRLDRSIARRADGVIALSERARAELTRWSRAPVALIPPGLHPTPPPSREDVEKVCTARGLARDAYALYTGNLDAYQDLGDLVDAAARMPEQPVVVATHGPLARLPGVRVLAHCTATEMRALTAGARITLCPRRTCAGFPIKLLNYMEAGRAILAREGVGGTLTHERDAWLLPETSGATAFAEALATLHRDADLRHRLGAAARATLSRSHAWPALAKDTLSVVEAVVDSVEPARLW